MAKKNIHISETPATQFLRQHGVAFSEHVYDYVEHGGTAESARQLGVPEQQVVMLMPGDRQVSLKELARQIPCKKVEMCRPDVASRHSGYQVGGTSPFATRKVMPVYVEAAILDLPSLCINGGRRGYLVGIKPAVLLELLNAKPVSCGSAE